MLRKYLIVLTNSLRLGMDYMETVTVRLKSGRLASMFQKDISSYEKSLDFEMKNWS